jgi:type II secretory pathway predicted ATPase ExeA
MIPAQKPDLAVTEAYAALDDRTPVVLVTGRAGTGKSHFIRSLVDADPNIHKPCWRRRAWPR